MFGQFSRSHTYPFGHQSSIWQNSPKNSHEEIWIWIFFRKNHLFLHSMKGVLDISFAKQTGSICQWSYNHPGLCKRLELKSIPIFAEPNQHLNPRMTEQSGKPILVCLPFPNMSVTTVNRKCWKSCDWEKARTRLVWIAILQTPTWTLQVSYQLQWCYLAWVDLLHAFQLSTELLYK